MFFSLKPAPSKSPLPDEQVDPTYKRLREQVFLGTFIGYAGYYLLRKNFSIVKNHLVEQGYSKTELGIAASAIDLAYGISKFLMGNVSDRSDARKFLTLGLIGSIVISYFFAFVPLATSSVSMMFIVLFIGGWIQGMGWAPCGRSMVHWFSTSERGVRMAIWNTAHNVGGGLMGVLAGLGLMYFANDWRSVYFVPATVAIAVALITWWLMRDTPQSCGLPPIEEYKNEYPENYDESFEKEMTSREIFFSYVFNNKFLWFIAFANAFVYLIRYGVSDWAPVYLAEEKGYAFDATGWAYFAYEYGGIPGTLLCGWLSDRYCKGHRAPMTIAFMLPVTVAIFVYWWIPPGYPLMINLTLATIGFLIYGPVMMIGLHALELVPKKAAGTAAGLTGLFGYMFGALSANILIGRIVDTFGWNGCFILLIASCFAAMFFVALTWKTGKVEHHK